MFQEGSVVSEPIRQNRVSRFFGQYIIKHRFQFKISSIIFVILATSTLVMWFEGHATLNRMVDAGFFPSDDVIQHLRLMNAMIGKTGILILAIAFGFSLFLSHFIAGPIYRFEKTFEEMRSGNLGVIVRLRKRDEFQEAADLLNQALASLRGKLQKERDAANIALVKAAQLSETLRAAGKTAEAAQLDQLMAEFKNNSQLIQLALVGPKVPHV